MKIRRPFRAVHLLCILLYFNLFTSVQDVNAFKSKKILYGLALAHVMGLLKENNHGGSNVIAHPIPVFPMPRCRKKCKKDLHYHEHINVHPFEGGYDLGHDHNDDEDDDIGNYDKPYDELDDHSDMLDDNNNHGHSFGGKSSKYIVDDDDNSEMAQNDDDDEMVDDEMTDYHHRDSNRMSESTTKFSDPPFATKINGNSMSLKKYFKKWQRKTQPKSYESQVTTERNSYDVPEMQMNEPEMESDSTDESNQESNKIHPIITKQKENLRSNRHRSTAVKHFERNLRHKNLSHNSEMEALDSDEAQNDNAETDGSMPEPTMKVMKKKITNQKKKFKVYLKKIKIGQYLKPYQHVIYGKNVNPIKKYKHSTISSQAVGLQEIKPSFEGREHVPMIEQQGRTSLPVRSQVPMQEYTSAQQTQPMAFSGQQMMLQQMTFLPQGSSHASSGESSKMFVDDSPKPATHVMPESAPMPVDQQRIIFPMNLRAAPYMPSNANMNGPDIVAEQIVIQQPIDILPGQGFAKRVRESQ